MITNLLINAFFGFLAFSVSGGVALHDSRIDKVFAMVSPSANTSSHDSAHLLSHDMHIHGSRHGASEAINTDQGVRERSHKKYITMHHARFKLSMAGV